MKNNKEKKINFKWNVCIWDVNHDKLDVYDVVPTFIYEWGKLKESEKPKNKEEFGEFLKKEAQYHFWAKCEYEMIVHGWPKFKNDTKVDVYDQLTLNWDIFVDTFWEKLND